MKDYQNRSAEIDIVKGICILLVVLGHCLRGLFDKKIIPADSNWHLLDFIIYSFHMPVFFIVAGLFFTASFNKGSIYFWKSKISSIVYPYFLWTFIQGLTQYILSSTVVINHKFDILQFYKILWSPISPFWFLHALFFCNILSYLSLKYLSPRSLFLISLILFVSLFNYLDNTLLNILFGLIYFSFGILIYEGNLLKKTIFKYKFILLAIIGFFCSSIIGLKLGLNNKLLIINAITGAYLVYLISLSLLERSTGNRVSYSLKILGQFSMSIYVMHIMVLGLLRTILIHYFELSNEYILILVEVFFAILLPIMIHKYLISLNLNGYFGLPFSMKNQK